MILQTQTTVFCQMMMGKILLAERRLKLCCSPETPSLESPTCSGWSFVVAAIKRSIVAADGRNSLRSTESVRRFFSPEKLFPESAFKE